jgi:uncharacterized membrane protein
MNESDPGTRNRTPLWVKVFGIVAVVIVVALIVALVAGVQHGPGLH